METGMMVRHGHDVVVVGGGHAGIEAALAAARLGCRTLLVTHAREEIGRMPCNPAVGGLGKGHLVREIDALGGEMGRAIDAAGIQFRILNRRKGPAVQGPRAQADKAAYHRVMLEAVMSQSGLEVLEDDVVDIVTGTTNDERRCVRAVMTAGGACLPACRVILCAGTFLRGLMHIGHRRESGGREGAGASQKLSGALERLGFELRRLKTGTPPRLRRDSIDFACLEQQPGDRDPRPFSFRTRAFSPDQVVCHLTHTGEDTHALIRENLVRSPLYAGIIEGRGPRYCPSVEDKVVRFADKPRHLVFLEPEGRNSEEIYVNGLATSLPADVQEGVVRSMRGLERAVLSRYGYAVEYDSVPSYQVSRTMESKPVSGLYLAGQIIGTSGYEEAAAQGLVAGINAGLSLNDQQPLIFDRSEAYLGVLVDDLVTKDITEPYRMFTSRAEHRLALRCDNAGERLLPHAARIGLLPGAALARLSARVEIAREVRALLENRPGRAPDGRSMPVSELLLRPGVTLRGLLEDDARKDGLGETVGRLLRVDPGDPAADRTAREILEQVENDLKYAGYIAKQDKVLRRQAHLDDLELPRDLDYAAQGALSLEAREKLDRMRPATLAEASRIDGVRAGDLAVLTVLVRRRQGEAWNEAGER